MFKLIFSVWSSVTTLKTNNLLCEGTNRAKFEFPALSGWEIGKYWFWHRKTVVLMFKFNRFQSWRVRKHIVGFFFCDRKKKNSKLPRALDGVGVALEHVADCSSMCRIQIFMWQASIYQPCSSTTSNSQEDYFMMKQNQIFKFQTAIYQPLSCRLTNS